MRIILLLLLSVVMGWGQAFTHNDLPWLSSATTSSRWLPTIPTNSLILYGELFTTNGTFGGPSGLTVPANNNQNVKFWTNFSAIGSFVGSDWTADQALFPTNFISGGGGNGTSPRLFFGPAASSTRMVGPTFSPVTNKFTVIIVANCTRTSGVDNLLITPPGPPFLQYTSKALAMSQGTTITSAATMTTDYYVITAVYAADATSHIDTNGVLMVQGNAGSGNWGQAYIGNNGTDAIYNGNICRIWGWYGVLNSTDLANAVHQCGIDFGITTP